MNILVSACLLGVECRYNNKGALLPNLQELMKNHHLIPVCPEIMGGLATPRMPAELREGRVITKDGVDVTGVYEKGALETLRIARLFECKAAILKERSPSCGSGRVYDGTFTGTLREGEGVCAQLLSRNGIKVYGESRAGELEEIERY